MSVKLGLSRSGKNKGGICSRAGPGGTLKKMFRREKDQRARSKRKLHNQEHNNSYLPDIVGMYIARLA
jgi:hypothetical protein